MLEPPKAFPKAPRILRGIAEHNPDYLGIFIREGTLSHLPDFVGNRRSLVSDQNDPLAPVVQAGKRFGIVLRPREESPYAMNAHGRGSRTVIDVAFTFHQCELMLNRNHLKTSGIVFVCSWLKVLAMTTTLQSSHVLIAQLMTIPTRPICRSRDPKHTAIRQGWYRVAGSERCFPIARNTFLCHVLGPFRSDQFAFVPWKCIPTKRERVMSKPHNIAAELSLRVVLRIGHRPALLRAFPIRSASDSMPMSSTLSVNSLR